MAMCAQRDAMAEGVQVILLGEELAVVAEGLDSITSWRYLLRETL